MVRPRVAAALLLVLIAIVSGPAAAAAPTLAVTAAHPDVRGASLPAGAPVFLRVPYTTDVPVRIFGRPYRGGALVDDARMATHPSPRYEPGSGDALVWLAFDEPAAIDEIRIEAVAADGWPTVLAAVTMAVDLRWADGPASRVGPRPDWVAELRARHEAAIGEARHRTPGPHDWIWDAVVGLMFASVPAYLILQGVVLWVVRGRFKVAARGPIVVMGLAYALTVAGVSAGSNLTPLFVVFLSPLALAHLVVVLLLHARTPPTQAL